MTNEEKAIDYATTECCNSCSASCGYIKCNMFCNVRNAVLYGLAEGKPKWHDLRKDPSDLPDRMGIGSIEVYVAYSDNNCTDFASYNFDKGIWIRSEDYAIAVDVIAWCEIPEFEEE